MTNIQILFGSKGIKKAYEVSLKAKALDIKCMSSNYSKVIGDYFDNDYAPKLLKSSIKTREIILNSDENRQYADTLNKNKNQVAFLEPKYQSETDIMVFDSTVIFISYNLDNPFALVINDQETAKNIKAQYELLWQKADK